jgi:succinate dehydrogenase / fumarate reductase, iron-sulfur subunit
MAEFTLPKNSRVTEGKVWPRPANTNNLKEYRVYRWNPEDGQNPRVDTYFVDRDDCGPMILDGIIWIKNKIDPTSMAPTRWPAPRAWTRWRARSRFIRCLTCRW